MTYISEYDVLLNKIYKLRLKAIHFIMNSWKKVNFSTMCIVLKGSGIHTYAFNIEDYGKKGYHIHTIKFSTSNRGYKTELNVDVNGISISSLNDGEIFVIASFIEEIMKKKILKEYIIPKFYRNDINLKINKVLNRKKRKVI